MAGCDARKVFCGVVFAIAGAVLGAVKLNIVIGSDLIVVVAIVVIAAGVEMPRTVDCVLTICTSLGRTSFNKFVENNFDSTFGGSVFVISFVPVFGVSFIGGFDTIVS